MLLWPPLTGTQISPVASQIWVLPSGHSPGNRHDQLSDSGVVCASTPGMLDFQNFLTPPLLKSHTVGATATPQSEEQPAEWRMALVVLQLSRYKVDIAALSDTSFSEQSQLEEVGAGYTFFWSGRPKAD
ncbi:unnamed protein product [Schistocephalus solidus]|uniref:Uncharacterized protein n=1 Tax=Schistocephalus solidus TaxID=70667 RepID=A0A183SRH3_SCHSO|nr:unnamed protein product [Schistocephalus solidus]